ncbi:MAG: hypothetical protein MK135_13110, partial [Polyangiaceae bacterium]|nr:hypothetical protein [Polyangiaceae bacterium]
MQLHRSAFSALLALSLFFAGCGEEEPPTVSSDAVAAERGAEQDGALLEALQEGDAAQAEQLAALLEALQAGDTALEAALDTALEA